MHARIHTHVWHAEGLRFVIQTHQFTSSCLYIIRMELAVCWAAISHSRSKAVSRNVWKGQLVINKIWKNKTLPCWVFVALHKQLGLQTSKIYFCNWFSKAFLYSDSSSPIHMLSTLCKIDAQLWNGIALTWFVSAWLPLGKLTSTDWM